MDWEKWQQKKPGPQPPDLDKVFENLKRYKGRMPSFYLFIILALLVWLATGFYSVGPDEVGVVKRFGAYNRTTEPGLHYHLPAPVESVQQPKVTAIRRFEVGFRTVDEGPPARYRPVTDEALMLTGDENIIDIWFSVQYKIKDAKDFLFKVQDPEKTVRDAAESAMREVIGASKIDEALTAGKALIQQETEQTLQNILDKYESGLKVVAVKLQEVHPPQEVRAAFKDVASAREDQNKYINQAQGYANDILPKARGRAAEIVAQAEAYKGQKVRQAQGDAARFLSVMEEYQKAKDVTSKRLYLETMEKLLPAADKFVVPGKDRQSVLPILPLKPMTPTAEGQPAQQQQQ
jgi:membrane protease subunit HflK